MRDRHADRPNKEKKTEEDKWIYGQSENKLMEETNPEANARQIDKLKDRIGEKETQKRL